MIFRVSAALITAMFFATACGSGTPAPTPTPTNLPTITHALTVTVDPPEAGDFLLNPTPLDRDLYVRGRTVNIDALPKAGWTVDQWVGPVHDVSGISAQVTMDSSKSVVIRMQRSGSGAVPPGVLGKIHLENVRYTFVRSQRKGKKDLEIREISSSPYR